MSVCTWDRITSKMEVITNAVELVKLVDKYGSQLGKRHWELGINQMYQFAVRVLTECILGNDCDIKTQLDERIYHFKHAEFNLDCLVTCGSVLKVLLERKDLKKEEQRKLKSLKSNEWDKLGLCISNQRQLIKGMLKYKK